MLIDFSAKNFRSIRDSATLSFVAGADASLRATHCLATGFSSFPWITRGAAVYGANASGKSNLIFGLSTMKILPPFPDEFGPPAPTLDMKPATLGSLATISATAFWPLSSTF